MAQMIITKAGPNAPFISVACPIAKCQKPEHKHYYDVQFELNGKLTSEQYRLISNLLNTLVYEFDLELLETELE